METPEHQASNPGSVEKEAAKQAKLHSEVSKLFEAKLIDDQDAQRFLAADIDRALYVIEESKNQFAESHEGKELQRILKMTVDQATYWLKSNKERYRIAVELDDTGVKKNTPFYNKVNKTLTNKDAVEGLEQIKKLQKKWKKKLENRDKRRAAAALSNIDSDDLIS
jgi:hypothetical protein